MFIICFGNGLGNQMFQYAFYLAMKNRYPDQVIKMDINYIQCNAHNGFELNRIFDIPMDRIAKHSESKRLSNFYPGVGVIPAILRRLYKVYNCFVPHKNHLHMNDGTVFYPEVFHLDTSQDYLLDGTWENEQYFYDIKEKVINAFKFNVVLNERNRTYLEEIRKANSVSVHIRRGDYISAGFYILGKEYYRKAIDIVKSKCEEIELFVFTNDPLWVKQNMCFGEKTIYVTGNDSPNNYIDMFLMSQCKHNIIANSSFSFWGAYLNSNANKIVVAPDALEKNSKNALVAKGWEIVSIRDYN